MRTPPRERIRYGRQRRSQAIEEIGVRVGQLHRPRPWGERALLIFSPFNPDDAALWPHLLTGDLIVETLPCDHNSIVREPCVSAVVESMAAARRGQEVPSNRMSPITP